MLGSRQVLAHYDPSLPLSMLADALAYGVGVAISQQCHDGKDRPMAFASRTLSPSECKYSQLEKEALALIFGIKRFHMYLYGHKFSLMTDHKSLTLGSTQCHSHSGGCQTAEVGDHPFSVSVQHFLQTDRGSC